MTPPRSTADAAALLHTMSDFAARIKSGDTDALDLVLTISRVSGEIVDSVRSQVATFHPDLRRIVLDAVIRELRKQ